MANSSRLFSARNRSNTSVLKTSAGGTPIFTPGNRRENSPLIKQMPNKGQPARLSAQRPRSQSAKRNLASALKVAALKSPIRNSLCSRRYSLIDEIRSCRNASRSAKIGNPPRAQFLRQRKFRSRGQPSRKMVSLAVITQALHRNRMHSASSAVRSLGARDLRAVRHAETQNRQTRHSLRQQSPKVVQKSRRSLLQKCKSFGLCPRPIFRVARVQARSARPAQPRITCASSNPAF